MKTLLTAAASAALLAAPTLAQDAEDMGEMHRASELMGNTIYSAGAGVGSADDWNVDMEVDGIAERYTDIGEVEDLVIGRDGQVMGVVAEIGGVLDMGDKHVMLPMEDLRVVRSDGEAYYVTRMTEEQLEERESVAENWWS